VILNYNADAALTQEGLREAVGDDVASLIVASDKRRAVELEAVEIDPAALIQDGAPFDPFNPPAKPRGAGVPLDELERRVVALRDAVRGLHDLYDAHDSLNFVQPDSLAATYKASLDDWACDLETARDDVAKLAHLYGILDRYGFEPEYAGGGMAGAWSTKPCANWRD